MYSRPGDPTMQKFRHFLSRLGNSILIDLIEIPFKIIYWAIIIFLVILKFVSGFFMWGGLIMGLLVWTGNASWEENWIYILIGIVAFIARYLSGKIMKAT